MISTARFCPKCITYMSEVYVGSDPNKHFYRCPTCGNVEPKIKTKKEPPKPE
jgi:Zn finger protein HypA/HybF involved in hydrogenase expression